MIGAPQRERLQKLLAQAGFGSRRACEDLIGAGRVRVGERVAGLGDRADPAADPVFVDGIRVRFGTRSVVYLLNKPRGVLSAVRDDRGRPVVTDYVPAEPRVFPVGRLDRDTEGLLLLTNDGDLAQRLSHPSHGVPKTYVATVSGALGDRALKALRAGVDLDDGPARARRVRVLGRRRGSTLVEITISMGRNRIVRRMFDAVGHPVQRLARTAIGTLRDPDLAPGDHRRLTAPEVAAVEGMSRGGH